MRRTSIPVAVLAVALSLPALAARAAPVNEAQFPPKTVRDLITICTPDKADPMMTGAVNYCHGFVEGAVIVEEAHETQRGQRKIFCIPQPAPASDAALAAFTTWANADPTRLDDPAVDGMFIYLATAYPCGKRK